MTEWIKYTTWEESPGEVTSIMSENKNSVLEIASGED
jgi:hypothetical protein